MNTLFNFLNNNKIGLSCIPVINYIIFIIYSLALSIPHGIIDLEMITMYLPSIMICMFILFLVLKIYDNSILPLILLTIIAFISIIYTVYSMVTFKLKKKAISITTAREIPTIEKTTNDMTETVITYDKSTR
jgi:hypothetical protein